jgi:Domain of unknown function (DUF5665)
MFQRRRKSGAGEVDYEKLGRQLENVLLKDHIELLLDTRHQLFLSFMRGIVGGLGGVIGATVGVAALVFLLHQLGGIPVIGHYLNDISRTIRQY